VERGLKVPAVVAPGVDTGAQAPLVVYLSLLAVNDVGVPVGDLRQVHQALLALVEDLAGGVVDHRHLGLDRN
jgi:hypothetical protein